jgi:orotidine-5'-phosphate decarboxylase
MTKLAIALDNQPTSIRLFELCEKTAPHVDCFKVGLEAFTAEGPSMIAAMRERWPDVEIFLDLKLHDIPNTVARAVERIRELGVQYTTIHAQGGIDMAKAAHEAATAPKFQAPELKVLAVTVLTSLDDHLLEAMGIDMSDANVGGQRCVWGWYGEDEILRTMRMGEHASRYVEHLARHVEPWVYGFVCPTSSNYQIREIVGVEPFIVNPGIRLPLAATHDQRQTSTPQGAARAGAGMIVVGRDITKAEDPAAAAAQFSEILAETQGPDPVTLNFDFTVPPGAEKISITIPGDQDGPDGKSAPEPESSGLPGPSGVEPEPAGN